MNDLKNTPSVKLVGIEKFRPRALNVLMRAIEKLDSSKVSDPELIQSIVFAAYEASFVDVGDGKERCNAYAKKIGGMIFPDHKAIALIELQIVLDQVEILAEGLPTRAGALRRSRTGKVFVVHGRNLSLREQVCAVVRLAGLMPIVLVETAGSSRTIIELIEQYGAVDHAICLLTGDDVGGLSGEPLRPRARQNVIWEAGYFFGLLGRFSVSVIADENLELPSDISGLRPIVLGSGVDLKGQLLADLRLAGVIDS